MSGRNLLSLVAAAGMGVSVAACGGGSVGSTPAPTPAPTPTPTPPPSTANADLISLTQSETFTNDGALGSASYPTTAGNFTSASSEGRVNFVYDAPSRTYTMTTQGLSQSFAPGEIDAAQSNANVAIYKKVAGNTTDSLVLTKPGTSGPFNFKYVGGAFWQRTIQGATAINGNFVASSYGVETLDAAVPRSGGAGYDVTLLGVVARPDNLYSLGGEGRLTINFLDGSVTGTSFANGVREVRADNGFPGRSGEWKYAGQLAANTNAITGTMTLYFNTTDPLAGPGSGRLYGPAGDEVGIAYQGFSSSDRSHFVGVMLGRKTTNSISGTNPSLVNLQFDQIFDYLGTVGRQYGASNSSGTSADFFNGGNSNVQPTRIKYVASSGSFELVEAIDGNVPTVISTRGTADASLTDSRFNGYSASAPNSIWRMRIYKIGSGNSEIALTYSSYYNLEYASPQAGGGTMPFWSMWVPFGITTPNSAMPTTGTASYTGVFNGSANDGVPGAALASATGPVNFTVDFGTRTLTGNFHPVITYQSGATYDLGTVNLVNGIYDNPGVTSFGVVGPPGVLAQFSNVNLYNGILGGKFFGPNFQELTGLVYSNYVPQGSSSISGALWGAFGSKKN